MVKSPTKDKKPNTFLQLKLDLLHTWNLLPIDSTLLSVEHF